MCEESWTGGASNLFMVFFSIYVLVGLSQQLIRDLSLYGILLSKLVTMRSFEENILIDLTQELQNIFKAQFIWYSG